MTVSSTYEERRQRVLDAKRAGVRLTKTGRLRREAKVKAAVRYDRDTYPVGTARTHRSKIYSVEKLRKPNVKRLPTVVQLAA